MTWTKPEILVAGIWLGAMLTASIKVWCDIAGYVAEVVK